MSYLTVRAEQALIGAMLTDQPLPGELTYLRPDDFGHRVLRQIYTAILDLRDRTPLVQLPDAVASRIDTPGVDADWLRQLRDACPSVAHIAAYARMVQVSAFRREIAVEGERIATTAAVADHPADTGTAMTRMADALTHQAEVYAAFTALDDNQALQLRRAPAAQQDTGPIERARREDEVLADLLAHPEQARELARIVDPGTFTSGQRREVYQTMVMLAEAGDPHRRDHPAVGDRAAARHRRPVRHGGPHRGPPRTDARLRRPARHHRDDRYRDHHRLRTRR
jgi:replicative DNA helicase